MSIDALVNLLLAMMLGGAIGVERQWNQGMAGLRTNTLVAFGSACFVTIGFHTGSDRVAAQLVSGIGFLGAGIILHEGPSIRGLNTAATLWCAAATGALAGTGLRGEAAFAAIGVVLLNISLRHVQDRINRGTSHPVDTESDYVIEIGCDAATVDDVYQRLSRGCAAMSTELRGMRQEATPSGGVLLAADLIAHTRIDDAIGGLVRSIGSMAGVTASRWTIAPSAKNSGMRGEGLRG